MIASMRILLSNSCPRLTMLASGNLTEPATHLARQWFARLGVEAFDGPMPTLDARGGWWRRRRLATLLRESWEVAAGRGRRITPRRLKALERNLSELRAAHERGEWRLSAMPELSTDEPR